jgi:hypothetical protein
MMCVRKIHLQLSHEPTTMSLAYSSFLTKLTATRNGKCWLNSTPTVLLDSLLLLSCIKYQVFYFYGCLIAVSKSPCVVLGGKTKQNLFK